MRLIEGDIGAVMATDFGTGVLALTDLPDPCVLGTGNLLVAYSLATRLLTPPSALAECGEPEPYDSINLRDWLGRRLSAADIADLENQCNQVLGQDERVDSVTAKVSFSGGVINVSVSFVSALGPFDFVLAVSAVTAEILGSF